MIKTKIQAFFSVDIKATVKRNKLFRVLHLLGKDGKHKTLFVVFELFLGHLIENMTKLISNWLSPGLFIILLAFVIFVDLFSMSIFLPIPGRTACFFST
jgi:hypothetical protein